MKRVFCYAIVALLIASAGAGSSSSRAAQRAGELLDVLPEGNFVAVIDFQKIAASQLWTTLSGQDKLKGAFDKAHSEMADLGLKLTDLNTVAVVFTGSGFNSPAVAVTGRFDQNELLSRLRASGKVKLTSEKYKNFDIYRAESVTGVSEQKDQSRQGARQPAISKADSASKAAGKNDTAFVFHGANTIALGSLEAVRASVDVKTGARPGIGQNAKIADALAQNPSAAIRFAVAMSSEMTNGLKSSELPIPDFSSITLIFGSIDVASGLELNATLRSDTAEHAKGIADRLSGLLSMAAGYLGAMSDPKMAPIGEALKTVKIASVDADVKITGSLPMDLLNGLFSTVGRKAQ